MAIPSVYVPAAIPDRENVPVLLVVAVLPAIDIVAPASAGPVVLLYIQSVRTGKTVRLG